MVLFRNIDLSDHTIIYNISIKLFPKEEMPDLIKCLYNVISELSYVVIDNNNIIGFILVCKKQTSVIWNYLDKIKNGYEISFFGILPSYQGKGIGSKLLHYTLKNIFQYSSICWLSVDIMNSSAIQMYTKIGFNKWTIIKCNTITNYVMELTKKRYYKKMKTNTINI